MRGPLKVYGTTLTSQFKSIVKGIDDIQETEKQNGVNVLTIDVTEDFDNEEKVRIITSDYLANGGDKMWFFKDKKQRNRVVSIIICTILTIVYYVIVLKYI